MNKFIKLFGLTIYIAGIILMFSVDWKLGLGAFLLTWSHNLEKHL